MRFREAMGVAVMLLFGATSRSEVLRDTLCIVDNELYTWDPPCFCGGMEVFGESYNFQVADYFQISEAYWITEVKVDFLALNGRIPDQVCLALYEGQLCNDSRSPFFSGVVSPSQFSWDEFDDAVFGLYQGRRFVLAFDLMPRLPAGTWGLSAQPTSEGDAFRVAAAPSSRDACFGLGNLSLRWVVEDDEPCCFADPLNRVDWVCDGSFEPPTMSMRVEGIPVGDCVGGERVTAACKPGDGERLGKVVVKISSGQPSGTVTALFDPPDPQHISIALDGAGRGKGKFKGVALGEHRVFVCDAVLEVRCEP